MEEHRPGNLTTWQFDAGIDKVIGAINTSNQLLSQIVLLLQSESPSPAKSIGILFEKEK